MKEKRITKHQQIKNHLINHGSLTSWDAIGLYGYTRISASIFILRKDGWVISSDEKKGIDRNGNNSTYSVYRLISTPENSALKIDELKKEHAYKKNETTAANHATTLIDLSKQQPSLFD